jgi:hypothetical protein
VGHSGVSVAPPNGGALSREPRCLRGPAEALESDAKRYQGLIGARCDS